MQIKRLRVSPFSGKLHATNLAVHDIRNGQPLLRLQDLDVQMLPEALWQREPIVTHLGLEQPEAWVAPTPVGSPGSRR